MEGSGLTPPVGALGAPPIVTLKNGAWTNGLLSNVHRLWKDNILCDTQIKCLNNDTINAHSLVLASSSPFLKGFFSKARQGLYTLKMDTISAQIWQHLLEFLYTGCLQLPVSQLFPLYNMAKKLQIEAVESLCESYIQSTLTGTAKNVLTVNIPPSNILPLSASPSGAPASTNVASPASSSGGFVAPACLPPPPLIALDHTDVPVKQEPQEDLTGDVMDKSSINKPSTLMHSRTAARGRSSTTTPESGIYSFSNNSEHEQPSQADDHAAALSSGGEQDWNLKLQNVRSLRPSDQTADRETTRTPEATADVSAIHVNSANHDTSIEAEQDEAEPMAEAAPTKDVISDAADMIANKLKKVSKADLKCIPCNKSFKSKHGLRLHKYSCDRRNALGDTDKKYIKIGKMFKCKVCSRMFKNYTSIWGHLKYHTGEGLSSCTLCGAQFTTGSLLQRHMKLHVEKAPKRVIECPHCKMSFHSKKDLKNHELKDHKEKSMYICTTCGRRFNSLVIYRIHVDTHHEQDLRTCKECKQVFRNAKAMYSHSRVHKPYNLQKYGKYNTETDGIMNNDTERQEEDSVMRVDNSDVHEQKDTVSEEQETPESKTEEAGEEATVDEKDDFDKAGEEDSGSQEEKDEEPESMDESVDHPTEEMNTADDVEVTDTEDIIDAENPEEEEVEVNESVLPLDLTNKGVDFEGTSLPAATATGASSPHDPYDFEGDGSLLANSRATAAASRQHMKMQKRNNKKLNIKCTICDKVFKKQGMLAIHMRVHKGISHISCSLCSRQFAHQGALTRHFRLCSTKYKEANAANEETTANQPEPLKEVTDQEIPLDMTYSPAMSVDEDDDLLLSPEAAVDSPVSVASQKTSDILPVDMTLYQCSSCRKRFTDRGQLYHHNCVDSNGNPIVKTYTCKVCHEVFDKSTDFRRHAQSHRADHPRKYECKECNKRFISKGARETHMYTHKKKQFRCGQCDKMFRYEIVLAQHIYSYHDGPLPYACPLCTSRFATKGFLEDHLDSHSGSKPYKCRLCDAEFTRDRQLKNHMIKSHEESATPEEIDIPDSPRESLSETENTNSNNSTPGPFTCEVCKMSFHSKRKMVTHMYKHATATPFNCDCCSKEFFYKQGFVEHFKRPKHIDCKKYYAEMGQYPWQQQATQEQDEELLHQHEEPHEETSVHLPLMSVYEGGIRVPADEVQEETLNGDAS